MKNPFEKRMEIVFGISRGLLIYLLYVIVTFPASFLIRNRNLERYMEGFWTEELYCIVSFAFSLVFFFSLVSIFTLSDNSFRKSFVSCDGEKMRFGKKLAFVLSSKLFWIEALSLSLIVALLPYASPLSEFCYAFLKDLHLGFLQENLLIALCIVPIFFALTVFAKLSTLNWWQRLIRKKILKKDKRTFLRMVLQLLYTSIAYIAAAFVLPIVIVMVCSLAIVANYVLIGFFGAVICVTLLILIVRYGADLRARRKLMNQLKKICNTSKYKITDVKNVYLTVFFQREGSNFTIETENVSFCCKFVRCPSRKKAIYFRDCGEAYYNSDFLNVIKHSISCEYFFETKERLSRETKKIIVVTPEAARLLATDDATDRLIYSGDAVMGYKVYQSSAFIGAVERRCL